MVRRVFASIALGLEWQLGGCHSVPLSDLEEECVVLGSAQQPFSGGCFGKELEPVADPARPDFGQVPCRVAMVADEESPDCDCAARGLLTADATLTDGAREQEVSSGFCDGRCCRNLCFCELPQLSGADLQYCWDLETRPFNQLPIGWCYVEPDAGFGSPELVAKCPTDRRRLLRVVPETNFHIVLLCQG